MLQGTEIAFGLSKSVVFTELLFLNTRHLSGHLWLLALTIAALFFYAIGSHSFYHRKPGYLLWLGGGILADIFMAVAASLRLLPVLSPGEGVPYHSVLFVLHITSALLGMTGFLLVFFLVLVRGRDLEYARTRAITYKLILPVWALGASIAIVNFLSKTLFGTNLYSVF